MKKTNNNLLLITHANHGHMQIKDIGEGYNINILISRHVLIV